MYFYVTMIFIQLAACNYFKNLTWEKRDYWSIINSVLTNSHFQNEYFLSLLINRLVVDKNYIFTRHN